MYKLWLEFYLNFLFISISVTIRASSFPRFMSVLLPYRCTQTLKYYIHSGRTKMIYSNGHHPYWIYFQRIDVQHILNNRYGTVPVPYYTYEWNNICVIWTFLTFGERQKDIFTWLLVNSYALLAYIWIQSSIFILWYFKSDILNRT